MDSGKKLVYPIDGSTFKTLDEFFDVISKTWNLPAWFGRNLDAFNDILRSLPGSGQEGFIIRWKNSYISKINLEYAETTKVLMKKLQTCHPDNIKSVEEDLTRARLKTGPTVFDWLVEIIKIHCSGGDEQSDKCELVLE